MCLDDFLSSAFPKIAAATFEFLARHPYELKLFLCGAGKGVLCRAKKQRVYRVSKGEFGKRAEAKTIGELNVI